MRGLSLCLVLTVLAVGCGGDDGAGPEEETPNRRPQVFIQDGSLYRAVVEGEIIALTAVGTDADGDPLTYRWSITAGTSQGILSATEGETINWVAGADAGDVTIEVIANDGTDDSTTPDNITLLTGTSFGGGTINGDRLWEASRSPYVVLGDLTIGAGATLTIEAGTDVYLRPTLGPGSNVDPRDFIIQGVLLAVGNAKAGGKIRFQGGAKAEFISALKKQWKGLNFQGSEPSQIVDADLSDAQTALSNRGTGLLTVIGGSIQDNINGIILVDPDGTVGGQGDISTTILRRVTVAANTVDGVRLNSSALSMSGCTIASNGGYGLTVAASTDVTTADIDSCSISQNEVANVKYENNLQPFGFTLNNCNMIPDPASGVNLELGSCAFGGPFDITRNYWGVNAGNSVSGVLATFDGHQGCTSPDFDGWIVDVDWFNTPVVLQ